jgi:fumarylacetoacetase
VTLPQIDHTHEPSLTSWVASANGHAEFPIQNLPLGVFSPAGSRPRIGVAIGESVLDLAAIADFLPEEAQGPAGQATLNDLFALLPEHRGDLRRRLSHLLSDEGYRKDIEPALHDRASVTLHLPARIGDYTDFYVGIHHATNVGKLFRPDNPLLPNYKYVPIGYHGRASSVRPSGEPVVRPRGQRKAPDAEVPVFEPSARLDYELELGIWVAQGNALGTTIPIGQASAHIAGLSLLNDWSARDLQAWEYQPLGPFLAKNFHTTISPWVVTAEALAPFRIAQPARLEGDPAPLPYLLDVQDQAQGALSLSLSVWLSSAKMREDGLLRCASPRARPATCTGRWRRSWRIMPRAGATSIRAICWEPAPSPAPRQTAMAACWRSRRAASIPSPCPPARRAASCRMAMKSPSPPALRRRAALQSALANAARSFWPHRHDQAAWLLAVGHVLSHAYRTESERARL